MCRRRHVRSDAPRTTHGTSLIHFMRGLTNLESKNTCPATSRWPVIPQLSAFAIRGSSTKHDATSVKPLASPHKLCLSLTPLVQSDPSNYDLATPLGDKKKCAPRSESGGNVQSTGSSCRPFALEAASGRGLRLL
jgi:hypothetical protein